MESVEYAWVDPKELVTAEPFSGIFPVDPKILDSIRESMQENGYDRSKPINIWRQKNVIVDGHTRRRAAIDVGIGDVAVCFHDFETEDDAFEYAVASQVARRNLTDAEIYRVTKELDRRRIAGRPANKLAPCGANFRKKSAEETANKVGTYARKVEAVRAIIDNASEYPDIEQAVLDGKETIRMAESRIRDRKKKKEVNPRKKKEVVQFMPAPSVNGRRKETPSLLVHSDEDESWLASLPLRAKVVADRFDEDALLWRHFAPVLGRIRPEMLSVVGERSALGMSILYRALFRVSHVAAIEHWYICDKCDGSGQSHTKSTHTCRYCHGGGYLIPGLNEKD